MVGKVSENPEEAEGATAGPDPDAPSSSMSDNPNPNSTPRRKAAPRKAAKKTATRSKADLQADLDKLEARLKRADSVTRKSVESLETVVTTLQASLKTAQSTQKGQLTKHVNRLTRRLDAQVDDTKALIRRELRDALAGAGSTGGVDALDAALSRATERMDEAEISQAAAITRVNRHLADIARAVDARLKDESDARQAEMATIDTRIIETVSGATAKITDRISIIERDSARAFDKIGETMEQLHRKVEQRRSASEDGIGERIAELAAQTQSGFDAYQSRVEQRFEEMEARHIAVGTGVAERAIERVNQELDEKINALKSRLAELERRPVEMPALPAPVLATQPKEVTPEAEVVQAAEKDESQSLRDRLTSFRKPSDEPATLAPAALDQTQAANPYAAALGASAASGGRGLAVPAAPFEPLPSPFEAQDPGSPVVAFPVPVPPAPSLTPDGPPLPPFQMPTAGQGYNTPDFESAPLPEAVYANPAYADDGNTPATGVMDSPMAIRVAGENRSPRRKLNLPSLPLSSPPFRIALLAGGVVIIAFLAGRMILGTGSLSSSDPQNVPPAAVQTQPAVTTTQVPMQGYTLPTGTAPDGTGLPQTDPALSGLPGGVDTQNAPIGDYVETQPVTFIDAELDTLDAAVEAGNPIAQFQMGLAKLDAGETEDGAALVREAASANQPAALYRLAKLYEAGEGVPRDDTLARQLIERAARGGNRIAMHDLGLYYAEGRGGVEMNMLTAKAWFEQAARRDVVDSQYNLAVLSESPDTGAEPDTQEAFFWYSIAARQGDQFAIQRRDALRNTFDAATLSAIQTRLDAFQPREIDEAANGIFTNLPWVQANAPATRDQIRTAQARLAALGYQVGTPDGLMGERTRTAIRRFQRENGLTETGNVNAALLNRLSQAGGA